MDNVSKGSKSNLNESSVPLLEDEEVTLKGGESKVTIEMDTRTGDENETVKEAVEATKETKEDKDSKKKEKKEKKEKKKIEKSHKRTSSYAEQLTAGLNLLDRDDRNVNGHINIVFEDVIAEPDANHGFDFMWRLAFIVFSGTKLWVYRIFSALMVLPCGILWGAIFSLLILLNVWIISPLLRTFDILLYIIHRVWSGLIRTFLDPVFQSIAQMCSNIHINTRQEL